jgi:Mrp family chromosome partitioning ATPase
MSRIDDAMKRASGALPADAPPAASPFEFGRFARERPDAGRPHIGAAARTMSSTDALPPPTPSPGLPDQYARATAAMDAAQRERGLKSVMITSAVSRAVKTQAAVNLALMLGRTCSRRVLLVDADLEEPSLHDILRIRNDRGLSDALRAGRTDAPVLELSPLFAVLTAGDPARADATMVTSPQMSALLTSYGERFDWVLLDGPPTGAASAALGLARRTDGVVLVIDAASPLRAVEAATAALGRGCLVATVLLGLDDGGGDGG